MNIGIIHGFVGGGGGTEKTFHEIIKALENTEHNVTLYTFSKPKIKSEKIKIKTTLPISIPFFGLYQRAMESKLISKAKNEDILIQASGGLGCPSNIKQKIIIYAHGDFSNELENSSSKYKGIWSLYYKTYYSMIKKFIEKIQDPRIEIISNSKYVQNQIQSKFKKSSTVIYPPVKLDEFYPEKKENKIVSVGRFSQEKNHDFGINVAKQLSIEFNIIGNTKTKSNILYYEKLSSLLKNESIKNIHLLKNIERKNLIQIMNSSKVFFHFSKETFGISIVEGIAAGCLPIVPDNSAHNETVPYEELRYRPNDITDATKKLKDAISGKFDHLMEPLKKSIYKFDKDNFKKQFQDYLDKTLENLS